MFKSQYLLLGSLAAAVGLGSLAQAEPTLGNVDIHLSPIAKNADGSVRMMNQFTAAQYCANRKMRLPTVREWGVYAAASSPYIQGIKETQYWDFSKDHPLVVAEENRMREQYFFPIYRLGSKNQIVISFYYQVNDGNYSMSEFNFFWSSSVVPGEPTLAYGYDSYDWSLSDGDRTNRLYAVRCVIGRR